MRYMRAPVFERAGLDQAQDLSVAAPLDAEVQRLA